MARSRKPSKNESRGGGAFLVGLLTLTERFLRHHYHLGFWPALGLATVIVSVTGVVIGIAWVIGKDMFFREVPPSLADAVISYQATGGWHVDRRHPLSCTEWRTHVHMTSDVGGKMIIIDNRDGSKTAIAGMPS